MICSWSNPNYLQTRQHDYKNQDRWYIKTSLIEKILAWSRDDWVFARLWRGTCCSGAGDQNKAAEESRLRNQNRNRERERSNIKIPVTGLQLMRRLTNQPHLCPRHAPWCKLAFNLPNPTEAESTSKLKAAQSYGIGNRIREQSRWVNNYWGAGALEERDYAVMCGLFITRWELLVHWQAREEDLRPLYNMTISRSVTTVGAWRCSGARLMNTSGSKCHYSQN